MLRRMFVRGRVLIAATVVGLAASNAALAQVAIGPAEFAGIFGTTTLSIPNPNNGNIPYTLVPHSADNNAVYDALEYDAGRGWGFEVITGAANDDRFGPFDNSTNTRGRYDDIVPDQLYDSFIGFKDFTTACNAGVVGNPDDPCSPTIPAEGGVFRIDVPNGQYRFVGVFGSASNNHAQRVLVENGGSGAPADGIGGHVVLASNHDQAQWVGQDGTGGGGAFATVAFPGKAPPATTGSATPVFINMDSNGLPAGGDGTGLADSPVLNVTEGYLRLHLLQANSNAGDGGVADPNGGDIVLFEVYPVGEEGTPGDVNGDGVADILDFNIIRDNFRKSPATLEEGNLDFNSEVGISDFRLWKDAFEAGAVAAPEPGTIGLLLLGVSLLGIPTRRRSG